MPELPEVETVVRQLKDRIVGRRVEKLVIDDPKVVDPKILGIIPFQFSSVSRRCKSIIFTLDKSYHLLTHLRMTGHFYHVTNKSEEETSAKYKVATFYLSDGTKLTHNSIRKFGRITLMTPKQLESSLANLGPEPLEITKSDFVALLDRYTRAVIKSKLLDQSFLAGIGNIYAQEALYHAGIPPTAKINKISKAKKEKLFLHLQRTLNLAIENNGTTINNFSHIDGKGSFQDFLAVYQKQLCPKKHPLRKDTIGGRGTYYCPTCQK